jgi:hypothetical protein
MPKFILEIVECPECAAPAEVVDRFLLDSTDGPIEHAIVRCVVRHRLTVLVERLASSSATCPGASGDAPVQDRERRATPVAAGATSGVGGEAVSRIDPLPCPHRDDAIGRRS